MSLTATAARRDQKADFIPLRAAKDAEYVLPELLAQRMPNGGYRVRGRINVRPGESLELRYDVDLAAGTYTTRILSRRRHADPVTSSYVTCNHTFANVTTIDPADIEVARTTSNVRWTADTWNGTVSAYRSTTSCWANAYTAAYTTWYVQACYPSPATGFGYNLWKVASGSYINWDFNLDNLSTTADQWSEIWVYGTASAVSWDALHDGEFWWLLSGILSTDTGSFDGECGFQREPLPPRENCPLILDLNGDGLHTTAEPVEFDLDGDGTRERMTWTNPVSEEAFLWIDLDENHRVDNGSELFGTGTVLPDGTRAANGFQALAAYDQPANGGDGNGVLAVGDRMWGRLRLWVDRNHDGQSSNDEIGTPASMGVTSLSLAYEEGEALDDFENDHRFRGRYVKRLPNQRTLSLVMNDVFFRSVR